MKQTIPIGWEEKTITDIANVTTGKWDANHSKTDGLYKFFTCASKPMLCDTYRYDGECLILPGNGANVGDVYYFNGKFDAYQRTYVISDVKYLSVKYLYYFLLCYWRDKNLDKQYGAATNYIKIGNFQDFVVLFPTKIEEQRHIVEKLDKLFADIEKEKQIAQQNLQNAKDLFESTLNKIFTENIEEWTEKDFENCIKPVTYTNKIQRKNFLESGEFPIVSQEDALINGYWNNATDLFKVTQPVVIFGDHTKKIKYIDFDFVLGADGVKILVPIAEIIPKYFYYCLQSIKIRDLGYARHYRLLKEKTIKYPDLQAQKEIIEKLDALHEQTQELEQIYNQQIADLDELKQAILKKTFNGEL